MKPQTIINSKTILFLLILLLPTMPIFADGLGDLDTDPDVPIDGGLSLLVAAGVGYGAKKLRKKSKCKQIAHFLV